MKYETLETNELIGVKLPPQEGCEANLSSVSATSEYRIRNRIVLYCIVHVIYNIGCK